MLARGCKQDVGSGMNSVYLPFLKLAQRWKMNEGHYMNGFQKTANRL